MRQCNDYVSASSPAAAAAAAVSPAVYDVDCFAFPRLCLLPSALGQRPDPASDSTPLLLAGTATPNPTSPAASSCTCSSVSNCNLSSQLLLLLLLLLMASVCFSPVFIAF